MSSHELDGWPVEDIIVGENYAPERKVVVDWSDRYSEVGRLGILEYQYAPGCYAYPKRFRIEPLGAQTNAAGSETASYDKALITVRYTTGTESDGNGILTEWIEDATEEIGLTSKGVYNASGEQYEPQTKHALTISGCVFHHVRNQAGLIPAGVLTSVGSVNSNVVYSSILGIWFAAETLRVAVPEIKRSWTTAGMINYSIHQKFYYRYGGGYGWNGFFDSTTATFQPAYNASGSRLRDFSLAGVTLV